MVIDWSDYVFVVRPSNPPIQARSPRTPSGPSPIEPSPPAKCTTRGCATASVGGEQYHPGESRCACASVWVTTSVMEQEHDGRAIVRDALSHRPHEAAVVLTQIPGITSAILREDGTYIVRFDRSVVSDDEVLAIMDREGLEVVRWDGVEGASDVEERAAATDAVPAVAGNDQPIASAPGETDSMVSVLLRGGPLDGESRLFERAGLLLDEPLTLVERGTDDGGDAPGIVGVMEYLYRGDGIADYVGGLPGDEPMNV
jgi:hypothetical protein